MNKKPNISEIFIKLKDGEYHKTLIKKRIIKIILGSSVIRALPAGTKPELMTCLESMPTTDLSYLNSQKSFDTWHRKQVAKLEKCLAKCDVDSNRFEKDEAFGHAAKVFNLFMSHLILYSAYFRQDEINNIKHFLHVPLDSKVFSAIRIDNSLEVPTSIKSLKSKTYYSIQEAIREGAAQFDLPPIYFDEYAWTRDEV